MLVRKSSGITENFDSNKLLKILGFATAGTRIDPNEIMSGIMPSITDGMSTKDIQKLAIKFAADRISIEQSDYQYVSARLQMYAIRKDVYNQFDPIHLKRHTLDLVQDGIYDKDLAAKWTDEEFNELNSYIKHERDFNLAYAGVMQFKEKYLAKDRSTGELYETPQMLYMLVAMCLHQDEKTDRIAKVKNFYDVTSLGKLSLPTPILAGVRTPTRQFSSCVKIECGDELDSINATASSIVDYISKRAGIGINGGAIRAEGSRIRSGEVRHTGIIPFWKHFQTAVKSCSQGGVRGGAATLYYPMWHLEVEKILVLKNNKGVEENRIRQLDYGIQINKLFFERLKNDDYITLFSPDVQNGELYNLFYSDPVKFKEMYEMLENEPWCRKKRIKASELFNLFAQERTGTGRIYPMFVDNVNSATPYKEPIRQSNLCIEIALPTYPVKKDGSGEVALCTLAAYNLGAIEGYEDFLNVARAAVRALDNLLDYQDYPVVQALAAKKRRALGIGVTNFAYFLAKNFVNYSSGNANKLVHRTMEMMQFANLVASMELAKERGANEWHHKTKWADGLLPIDWYNKNVDNIVPNDLKMDWEWLRSEIKKHGLRNDTLSAFMPCESSSQITNSTNGIEPPRGLVSTKQSKDGVFNQLVPEVDMLGSEYETAWQMTKRGMKGYLDIVAIMQKFVDQMISANTYYDPAVYPGEKIPMKVVLKDMSRAQKHGVKSLYYSNTRDGADGTEDTSSECETCKV
ncbi:aerobic NDP reductase large subunit [Aeromonas phage Ah1]|uniref:Ribonucleoside-diphosphate reductase n=1 Tax=Aeromonas phage Ah1 TaxID=2053701 RepID=A0A2H4YF34_9CAUD|nr:ribonucleotide reductase [Aeromonas phage Ah1]AUE22584.1 aerobic NDP reductase large subunit [Aeromonas phage Ah1]